MKRILLTLAVVCVCLSAFALELNLNWNQPPNYKSTVYSSTNLLGEWTPLVENAAPPIAVDPTNQTTFFYVSMELTNRNIYIFTNDAGPNAQGIIPDDINAPNIAHWSGGNIWIWDTNTYMWE